MNSVKIDMLSAFCCCSIRKFFIDITDNQKFGISVPQVRELFRIAIATDDVRLS